VSTASQTKTLLLRAPKAASRRSGLGRVILRRLLVVPFLVLAVITVVFFCMRLVPGSPATALGTAGTDGLTQQQVQENIDNIAEQLGLNKPLWLQYLDYIGAVLRLDLGYSAFAGQDVTTVLATRLPATLELTIAAMFIAVLVGGIAGIIAAVRRGRTTDNVILWFSTVSFSLPWFALGILGIMIFSVGLGWLPVLGRMPASLGYVPTTGFVLIDAIIQGRPELIGPWLVHLILPATTLAIAMAGFITRMTRASVLEVLDDDFVRTARMKGLSEPVILRRHVLRNSALPVVTVLGLQFGALLSGSVITEMVFAYPGVGNLIVSAVNQRDYMLVQGAVLIVAFLFILTNVIVDLLYLVLDPRLRKA